LNIATAVVIYPLVKRQSETVSLGYLTARIMESTIIAIGLMSIISVLNVADALDDASRRGRDRAHRARPIPCPHLRMSLPDRTSPNATRMPERSTT
jgi:hypothetical protein